MEITFWNQDTRLLHLFVPLDDKEQENVGCLMFLQSYKNNSVSINASYFFNGKQ